MSQRHPGFSMPKPDGKFNHPWMMPLSSGKTKSYNLLYKGAVSVCLAFTAYGLFEVARGSWYIARANAELQAQLQQEAAEFKRQTDSKQ